MTTSPSKPRSVRWAHLNAFVDFTLRALTPAEAAVWLVLFRDTKPDDTVRTGQSDIAMRAGLSVRMVKKAIRKLKERGLVKVLIRGRLNCGPNVYKVRGINPS